MDSHKTFTLKVDINCCQECQVKSTNKLKKMDGVDSVNYDSKKKMIRVSGNIDPAILIEKFGKWGKKAKLYSSAKDDSVHTDKGKCNTCGSGKKNSHGVEINSSEGSFDSDGDSGHCKEQNDVHAPKNRSDNDNIISWQHPRLMRISSPKEESPVNKQSAKRSKNPFGRWFSKKEKAAEASSNNSSGSKSPGASKWHFPRTSTPEYSVPRPFARAPYGDQRPYYLNQYPPPPTVYPWPMPPYYGNGSLPPQMLPLMMSPYSYFQSRPPPSMNPMIHYTSYRDNNFYYP